jgi:tight adherence protein C
MDDQAFAALAVFVAALVLFIWLGAGVLKAKRTTATRLTVYGSDALREETLKKPISERAVAPILLGLGRGAARFTPIGWLKRTQRRLVLAGSPGSLDANAWLVIKILGGGVALVLWFVVRSRLDFQQQIIALVLLVALGYFGPDVWLNRRIEERRESMRRDLPDMLDLLVISVEAGLGFDSALNRVVNTVPGPLSEEFFRMLQETRVGVARRDAMRHLTERSDVDELRSFLLAMMQAEAFGVAIARVLRVQADEMRVARRQRAQEKAFAAPVKLVFPLVFCIFPALFIVLLGPAAIQIYETFTGL